jgi:RNA polymerase sigma-70 factor (ECF subfamily)
MRVRDLRMSIEERNKFVELVRPVEERILRTLWRILRNADDADDAHQETLLRLWRYRKRIVAHPNPEALILRMCAQAAHDVLRRRLRRGRHEDLAAYENMVADTASLARERIAQEEQVREILAAIAAMPQKQAIAVTMRIIQQESYRAIAQALGCSEVTARSHVSRARTLLAERFAPHSTPSAREL